MSAAGDRPNLFGVKATDRLLVAVGETRDPAARHVAAEAGNEVAAELASSGMIRGIAAQRPFDQGVAAGKAALIALTGGQPPPWIALPGLAVTRENLVAAYQLVWHSPAPPALLGSRRT